MLIIFRKLLIPCHAIAGVEKYRLILHGILFVKGGDLCKAKIRLFAVFFLA
jgi:hypothetical protein